MSTPVHGTSAREFPVRQRPRRESASAPHPLHALQSRAGNAATYAAVQRARGKGQSPALPDIPELSASSRQSRTPEVTTSTRARTPAIAAPQRAQTPEIAVKEERKKLRDRMSAALTRAKKHFDISDTFVSRGQIPGNAGVNNLGATGGDTGISHAAAASGFAVGAENFLADGVNAGLDVIDARKARKDYAANPTGPTSHQPHKKTRTKPTDALSNSATTAGDGLSAVKDMLRSEAVEHALNVSEASGGVSGVLGVAKAGRHARRFALTQRKYSQLKKLDKPVRTSEEAVAQLGEANRTGQLAFGRAYVALNRMWDEEGGEQFAEQLDEALDTAIGAATEVKEAAARLRHAEDSNAMADSQDYSLSKQRHKMGKLAASAAGESLKAASGAATIATAVTAGLATTPVGWGLAAAAAGFLLGGALYKSVQAGKLRYEDAKDPNRWAPEGAEHYREPKTKDEALKESLKFWRKVEHGKRQAVAREIYKRAAGEAIPGSKETAPDMRASARALLIALKAGPSHLGLSQEAWAESLNDPDRTASWHAEIAAQLASG
ncbi:hypothetical protein RM574_30170 [Streptomyces sp. DSM 41982]|uniref:Type III effector protein n=1 Tax=Streptomyces evansiae TaxID=3075535 RepID=A0ABD5EHR2_9ACTN|nr:hypothetical protein [Streptomyces sp. DSM 41982]MDT0419745.1 hypothetical protein [Streptomyces sp. DSM 41982]